MKEAEIGSHSKTTRGTIVVSAHLPTRRNGTNTKEDNIQSTTNVWRGGRSDLQYGFMRGRSTVDAIRRVVDIARDAIDSERWRFSFKEHCAVVTLDVRNSFNSANWGQIM